jgi:arylsulfatase A-like enzyme
MAEGRGRPSISRRGFLSGAAGAAAAAWGGGASSQFARGPNFLFILVDDLGWGDLGCYGSTFYETPHIDRLAAGAVRFTNAYAACPVCSPTRASIMAGKYPARMDTTDWFGGPQPEEVEGSKSEGKPLLPAPYLERLPLEEVTLAEAFSEAGYATHFAGKWHLGPEGYWPKQQGFDVNRGGWTAGLPRSYFSPYHNPRLEDGPPGEHLPQRLAEETVQFIEAHAQEPFLAYLSFYSVHTPLQGRPDLVREYEDKRERLGRERALLGREGGATVRLNQNHAVYAAMVEAMDQAVGDVLNALERLGLDEDTVVIFMSDNGGLSTTEGRPTSNLPLRAGKGWIYEGGIREPMLIRWPKEAAPSVCETPVTSTDFYPTMLEMAGRPMRPEQHVDGVSLVPLLEGGHIEPRPLFWHYPHYGNQGGAPAGAVREGDWKLIEWYEDGRLELYNLRVDPGERYDLAANQAGLAAVLHAKLKAWREEVGAKMPSPAPGGEAGNG